MDIQKFRAGNFIKRSGYSSFEPNSINIEWIITSPEINELMSEANHVLGRLDMFSDFIPNIDLFIQMHVVKEATQSSRIEGTQTNIEDAVLEEEDVNPEKKDDWREVQNYMQAMWHMISQLETLPLSSRIIKNAHSILLKEVRGDFKLPGEFRRSQNWIGGSSLSDAVFIPPHHENVNNYMNDLEKFIHNDRIHVPHLLRIAIIHYQFETIHPFLDGNGRIGRLMIPIYLVSVGLLTKPILYLSDYFEKNRLSYYDNLTNVRRKNELEQWIKFFLVGIIQTCKSSVRTFENVLKLKDKVETEVRELGPRTHNALSILNKLYERPVIDAKGIKRLLGVSMPTAYTLLETLQELNILVEMTGAKRDRLFFFNKYLDLFRE